MRGYDLPAWVGPDDARRRELLQRRDRGDDQRLRAALERRCPVAVITTGGPLLEVARRAGLPLSSFPGGGQPRASRGLLVALLAGLLERAGVLDRRRRGGRGAAAAAADASVAGVRAGACPTIDNPAKQLAWALVDRLPVIEAAGFLAPSRAAGRRSSTRTASRRAVVEELPEATHNTVVGYEQPESLRDHLYVVFLASALDHPRNKLRAGVIGGAARWGDTSHEVVPVAGEGRWRRRSRPSRSVTTRASTCHPARLDPTPVDAIGHIKSRMSASEAEEDE